jgi:predicted DNA-binding WGR domain protein
MENLLAIVLEAHHAERNHHRRYEIRVGRDLLEDWTVCIRYGRVGQRGQEQRFGGQYVDELRSVVEDRLRRRLSAPRRLRCSYRVTEYSAATGFDAGAWFSPDLWMKFWAVDLPPHGAGTNPQPTA